VGLIIQLCTWYENKVVAERLGHSSVTTTMDTYSHVPPDMQRDAVVRMEEAAEIQCERQTPDACRRHLLARMLTIR